MLSQEASKNNDNNDEDFKERFRLACKADPLSVEFAKTCSSAVALLARTVSTFQMTNEIYGALCLGQEGMKTEVELEQIAKNCMAPMAEMHPAQILMMIGRLGASAAFTEYMKRLKIEQSKH
jgi:hypothetical protein